LSRTAGAPVIALVPMSDEAYREWLARIVPDYAGDNVAAGHWTPEEATERAEQQINQLLPSRQATPGQHLWSIHDASGADVGVLWVAVTPERPDRAFIYDIEIVPARRGEGFGTAALMALEEWAGQHGVTSIGLHVFGHNTGAWQLYKRLGYVETSVQMEKQL